MPFGPSWLAPSGQAKSLLQAACQQRLAAACAGALRESPRLCFISPLAAAPPASLCFSRSAARGSLHAEGPAEASLPVSQVIAYSQA